MSSILKIKQHMPSYTSGEKRIAEYIIKNKELVISQSSQLVGELTGTSPSSVVRFSKILGYKGFTDLKLQLAKDSQLPEIDSYNEMIHSKDSLESLVQKVSHTNTNTFLKTYKLLDYATIEASIKDLSDAHTIFLVGLGGSSIVAQDLYHKLIRINSKCIYNQDFHLLLTSLTYIKKEDCSVAFSYSGETHEAVLAQKYAHERGARTITITSNPRSTIARYSDHIILIPHEEKELRLGAISSRFSLLAISDLLYLGVAKTNLEGVSEKLKSSRELLKKLSR